MVRQAKKQRRSCTLLTFWEGTFRPMSRSRKPMPAIDIVQNSGPTRRIFEQTARRVGTHQDVCRVHPLAARLLGAISTKHNARLER
jgi:hypothetical protein